MSNFERKELKRTHTVADKLKNLRISKEITTDFLAKKLNIPAKYIVCLENGQHDILPGDIYVRAWLKKIANFYEVDASGLLVDYHLEKNINHKISSAVKIEKKKSLKESKFLRPKFLRWLFIGAIVLTLFIYLVYEIVNIIAPPFLNIIQPSNNFKTKEASVEIIGQTKVEAQLMINGELIVLDQEGKFKKNVNLTVGLNTLKISAKNKHSRTQYAEWLILRESVE
ncbi:MAG: cytoskeleton protein RodZ [Patescibacteria group bacterium]|nr:cytoskeleton protein RodZ [Patescibacteria group bacterium]